MDKLKRCQHCGGKPKLTPCFLLEKPKWYENQKVAYKKSLRSMNHGK